MFVGFLPKKGGKRGEMLRNIKSMNDVMKFSIVIYESTVRLEKILPEMMEIFGENTQLCLSLDLTKVSEKILRGTLKEVLEIIKVKKIKGEATLVVSL
jgi:16S rRNA (cytidine1402-2'-O)-methyltransferase